MSNKRNQSVCRQQKVFQFSLLLLLVLGLTFPLQASEEKQFYCTNWGELARYHYLDYQLMTKDESIIDPIFWIKESADYDYQHKESAARKLLDIVINGLVNNKSQNDIIGAVVMQCSAFSLRELKSDSEPNSENDNADHSWSHSELASETYCMQRSFSEFGNTRSCIENLALDDLQFDAVCNKPSDDLVKIESKYVLSCPANFKGVCFDLKTQHGHPIPFVTYLYENDMAFMKKSCIEGGGTWESSN